MIVLHTYTVVSNDFKVIHNQLDWHEAKDIATRMPNSLILTVKNNCISAVRTVKVEELYEDIIDIRTPHIEKTIINKFPHDALL